MIQIDGIPRSMYGREQPLVSFGSVSYSGINSSSPTAGRTGLVAGPSTIEDDGTGPTTAALPAVGWGERLRSRREYTMLKKVVHLLQDNRLQTGDAETAQRLQELNRTQTESFPILKTILNGIFVATGVILLVGVVAVIIYTSVVPPGSSYDILRNFLNLDTESLTTADYGEPVTNEGDIISPDDPPLSALEDNDVNYPDNNDQDIDDDHEVKDVQTIEPSVIAAPNREQHDGSSASSSTVKPVSAGSRRPGLSGSKQMVTKCRFVPVVHSGHPIVKLGEICLQVSASLESSSPLPPASPSPTGS